MGINLPLMKVSIMSTSDSHRPAFFSSLGAACVYVHCVVVWTMHPSNMWNTTYYNVQTCHQSISNFQIHHIITEAWWFRGVSRMAHGLHLPQGSGWTPTIKIRPNKKNKHNITQPSFVTNSGSKFPMRLTNQRKTRKVTPWSPPGGSMAKVTIRLWMSSLCSKIRLKNAYESWTWHGTHSNSVQHSMI